jgi:hypothetical protein
MYRCGRLARPGSATAGKPNIGSGVPARSGSCISRPLILIRPMTESHLGRPRRCATRLGACLPRPTTSKVAGRDRRPTPASPFFNALAAKFMAMVGIRRRAQSDRAVLSHHPQPCQAKVKKGLTSELEQLPPKPLVAWPIIALAQPAHDRCRQGCPGAWRTRLPPPRRGRARGSIPPGAGGESRRSPRPPPSFQAAADGASLLGFSSRHAHRPHQRGHAWCNRMQRRTEARDEGATRGLCGAGAGLTGPARPSKLKA